MPVQPELHTLLLRGWLNRAVAPVRGGNAALLCSLVTLPPRAQILLQHPPL